MKILLALYLIVTIVMIMSCQQPVELKNEVEKQAAQIKMLEDKVELLNNQIEQMRIDFEKHLEDFHKKTSKRKKLPALGFVSEPVSIG